MAKDKDLRGKALWVSWCWHRRTASICAEWGVPLEVVDDGGHMGWRRRSVQIARTVRRLWRAGEEVIFVQNPSLGLAAVACLVRQFRKFRLVVDAHNEGVRPFNRRGRWIELLTEWLLRTADVTMVTNDELAAVVTQAGGNAVVLPDPLPDLENVPSAGHDVVLHAQPFVFVIATFAPDEPIDAILMAAAALDGKVRFIFSGDPRAAGGLPAAAPENVIFAGYLPEDAFLQHMRAAACVLDLSMKPDCLTCGAYEALALRRPAVLSDSPAARRLFREGVELVDNSPVGIQTAVERVVGDLEGYRAAAGRCASDYLARWAELSAAARNAVWRGRSGQGLHKGLYTP